MTFLDKTRFLALVKFREQSLNFLSVQATSMLLHTSNLQKENAKGNEKIVGFGT